MNKLLSSSKAFINRNAPTILTCVGGVGVVATAVLAVKATPKALSILEKAKEEKGEELTKFEVVKKAGPVYIPAVVTGASTLACIFGANVLNKRRQAALMSAYALLDNSYKEYKNKVRELYGEDANGEVAKAIAKDKYEDADISIDEDGQELFFDVFSNRYFRSTKEKVLQAEYNINRDLSIRDQVTLNDFYQYLDIPTIDTGHHFGWSVGGNLACYWQSWIDFHHEKVVMDDGLECQVITMLSEPSLDFCDYW